MSIVFQTPASPAIQTVWCRPEVASRHTLRGRSSALERPTIDDEADDGGERAVDFVQAMRTTGRAGQPGAAFTTSKPAALSKSPGTT